MKRDYRSVGKVQRTQFNTITRTPKEFNTVTVDRDGTGRFVLNRENALSTEHDLRTLNKGGECYDDNCIPYEQDKRQSRFHHMLSKTAYRVPRYEITYYGYTGIPIEIREFNIMIRPISKIKKEIYYSPNYPNYPRYFVVNQRDYY